MKDDKRVPQQFYYMIVHWTELTGCTMDDALAFGTIVCFIFIALLTWATWVAMDLGVYLYKGTKKLFCFIRRLIRREEKDDL